MLWIIGAVVCSIYVFLFVTFLRGISILDEGVDLE